MTIIAFILSLSRHALHINLGTIDRVYFIITLMKQVYTLPRSLRPRQAKLAGHNCQRQRFHFVTMDTRIIVFLLTNLHPLALSIHNMKEQQEYAHLFCLSVNCSFLFYISTFISHDARASYKPIKSHHVTGSWHLYMELWDTES